MGCFILPATTADAATPDAARTLEAAMSTVRSVADTFAEQHFKRLELLSLSDVIDDSAASHFEWRKLTSAVRQTYDGQPSEDEQHALYERLRVVLLEAGSDGALTDFLKYVDALALETMVAAEAAFALALALSRGKSGGGQ